MNKDAPVLVYDTATGGLAVGPATPVDLQHLPKLAAAAGDAWLYALDRAAGGGGDHFRALVPHGTDGWCWDGLGAVPFTRTCAPSSSPCTAGEPSPILRRRDRRVGVARPDAELDAWVGLRPRSGEGDDDDDDEPAWKVAEVIETGGGERTVAVTLAHVGGGVFCLVERRRREGGASARDGRCLLYATTFRLRHGKGGALRAADRRARCYAVHNASGRIRSSGRRSESDGPGLLTCLVTGGYNS
ncbi:hypothetical protein C2845_PM09G03400 [Panicum miliaceum]|uniref:Uncharacterized protein n=1 Tax=Panicum miliaceum TaxID=4540 RepID=A0A3L6RZE7_PANMI|nr:hypothetical protein C2845_PM09G03400 [Panicum miliaceum]